MGITLYGDRVTHQLQLLADPRAESIHVAVVLTASAGGPQETRRHETAITHRASSNSWDVFAHPPGADIGGKRRGRRWLANRWTELKQEMGQDFPWG